MTHRTAAVVRTVADDKQGVWVAPYADCTCGWLWEGEDVLAYEGDASVFTRQHRS